MFDNIYVIMYTELVASCNKLWLFITSNDGWFSFFMQPTVFGAETKNSIYNSELLGG